MDFVPSPYQQTIFDFVADGHGSAIVKAVAGSGKTKTIEQSLLRIPEQQYVHLFAFNASIAKELTERIAKLRTEYPIRPFRNVRASTFHSIGFGAIRKKLSTMEVKTVGNKCRQICEDWLGPLMYGQYADFICKLVSFAKGQGIGALIPDNDHAWWDLIHHHDLYLEAEGATEDEAIGLARKLLERSNDMATAKGVVDFDDHLYLPLLWGLRLWQNHWVFIDEAQDTSPVRRALAKLALRPGGRMIAVGDPRQAIYGFTGASHDAIDIIKREFNAIELPLTVSYRCCKTAGARARTLVPYFETHESAPEGKVETMDINKAIQILTSHDAVLCRNTAPLLKLAFGLMARKIPCTVLGREIGQGLVSLIKKMNVKDDVEQLQQRLDAFLGREVSKCMARGEEQKADALHDRVECIYTFIENMKEDQRSVYNLCQEIEALFSDSNGRLTLSTIHKSKGREWERVAILRPDLMPSQWARQDWQHQQELNIQYVAWTRAISHLIDLTGELKR